MSTQCYEFATEQDARERCHHVSGALDVLRHRYGIVVKVVGWQNWKDPELVVTLSDRMQTMELSALPEFALLRFDHETYSCFCDEHRVAVWSGI
jgi:hypothetical protein